MSFIKNFQKKIHILQNIYIKNNLMSCSIVVVDRPNVMSIDLTLGRSTLRNCVINRHEESQNERRDLSSRLEKNSH